MFHNKVGQFVETQFTSFFCVHSPPPPPVNNLSLYMYVFTIDGPGQAKTF